MTKTAVVLAALIASVGFTSIGNAQDLTKDEAYCRKLVNEYTLGGMNRGAAPESLDTAVAIDQCRSGNPEPAIPVLQEKLRDGGFTVPSRS
jgi:hypothetical protein